MMNKRTGMNALRSWAIALALLLPGTLLAAAPPDLAGVWQGKLAVDAKTSLAVEFTFTKGANGAYTAVLNSPDNPDLKNTAVSGVSWDGSSLKLQVPTLSGSYAGTLKNGKIGGQWTQPGGALALELAPFQKQAAATTVKALNGSWNGVLAVAGVTQNLMITFKQAADGSIEGTFSIPDQGFSTPAASITFENNELSFKVPRANIEYKGKLAGNQVTGKLKAPSPQFPADGIAVNLQRGEYKAKTAALKLTVADYNALKGKWQGTLEVPNPQTGAKVQLPLVLRFEANEKTEYLGFLDSPAQSVKGVAVTEATLAGGKLMVKIALVQGEFNGTLSGNTLTGEWAQAAANLKAPLTLTRQ
jgi:hypothetical protein